MHQEMHFNSVEGRGKRDVPANALDWPESKKRKFGGGESSDSRAPTAVRVVLNPADCDLDINIKEDGLLASALHEQGFAYCWSGARANVGVIGGKYCFGCKIVAAQPVNMDDTPLDQQHLCRLGISRGDDLVGRLGETLNSFGFGGTAKFANAGLFSGYGETFGVGDTIICCVDLESKPMASIGFAKNGLWLGIAKQFDAGPGGLGVIDSSLKVLPWESAIFPHVLLKNVIVQLQFSTEDGLVPQEGYKPWAWAIQEGKMILGPTFPKSSDCEVIMMVGLPASGKTTWAEKWVRDHPEKRYILLGTNLVLDQMKVPGLHRKNNYGERFDHLMPWANGIFNTLLSRASKVPRNFIIDQTNVFKSARKRKLKPFADYRKIAVVIFPRPEEMKTRADRRFREMGKELTVEAVNEMLVNYTLPMSKDMNYTQEYFDEVWFPELTRDKAQQHLDEMKANLRLKKNDISNSCQHFGISAESRESPLVQDQRSLPGIGAQWPSSYITQPPIGAPPTSHNLASSGYSGNNFNWHATNSGSHDSSRNVYQSGISYYPSPSPYLRNNYNPSEGYSGKHCDDSGFTGQGSMSELYGGHVVGHTYGNPSIGSENLLPRGATDLDSRQLIKDHPRIPVFPYSTANVYASQPTGASESTMPAPYGSPFGTSMQGQAAYGSFPGNTQYTRGYGRHPHPGYH